eukprot:1950439-Rhodomonas_salina.1
MPPDPPSGCQHLTPHSLSPFHLGQGGWRDGGRGSTGVESGAAGSEERGGHKITEKGWVGSRDLESDRIVDKDASPWHRSPHAISVPCVPREVPCRLTLRCLSRLRQHRTATLEPRTSTWHVSSANAWVSRRRWVLDHWRSQCQTTHGKQILATLNFEQPDPISVSQTEDAMRNANKTIAYLALADTMPPCRSGPSIPEQPSSSVRERESAREPENKREHKRKHTRKHTRVSERVRARAKDCEIERGRERLTLLILGWLERHCHRFLPPAVQARFSKNSLPPRRATAPQICHICTIRVVNSGAPAGSSRRNGRYEGRKNSVNGSSRGKPFWKREWSGWRKAGGQQARLQSHTALRPSRRTPPIPPRLPPLLPSFPPCPSFGVPALPPPPPFPAFLRVLAASHRLASAPACAPLALKRQRKDRDSESERRRRKEGRAARMSASSGLG